MTAPYHRTAEQKAGDFAKSREFEQEVSDALGVPHITNFTSPTALDIWVPGVYIEVKEKRQRLTQRWHLLPGVPEHNLFVMDELTVRRAGKHYPYVMFVIRDVPQQRLFAAPIWEVNSVERARRNRVGKGKWIVDMTNFRQLESLDQILPFAMDLFADTEWLRSECLTAHPIPQV